MNDFKKLAVLGLGVSNRALVRMMEARGVACVCWDDGDEVRTGFQSLFSSRKRGSVALKEKDPCFRGGSTIEIAVLTDEVLRECDALVVAPGIGAEHEVVRRARDLDLPVMCDVELWGRMNAQAKVIGITGTNGKSTVTAMVTHILREAGIDVQMGGNIGKAVFDLGDADWTVLELSSFQIEYCPTFRPAVAALLNLSPDHLDRHGDMDGYARVKASLFDGVQHGVIAVDDKWTRGIAGGLDVIEVSGRNDPRAQNEAIAVALAGIVGVDEIAARAGLESFVALPHRQQCVRVLDGVTYINDSKATNVESARAALCAYKDVIWIVGGQAKDGGLAGLENCLDGVVQALVVGAEMDAVTKWLSAQGVQYDLCGTVERAVKKAGVIAGNGQTVLLSPACASYDQYRNFEERGTDFEERVHDL